MRGYGISAVEVEVRNIVMNDDGTVEAQIIVRPLGADEEEEATNVAGNYIFSRVLDAPGNGFVDRPMTLQQDGSTLTGIIGDMIITVASYTYDLAGSIDGETVTLVGTRVYAVLIVEPDLNLTGTANANGTITGTWEEGGNTGTWTATPE